MKAIRQCSCRFYNAGAVYKGADFEKLNIIDEQPCRGKNSKISELNTFTDVDTILGYIKKATASSVDKETIKDFIMEL